LILRSRFVPVETSFEEDPIHEEATEATIAAAGPDYQGVEFVTDVSSLLVLRLAPVPYARFIYAHRLSDILKSLLHGMPMILIERVRFNHILL
jgi:hypothetical protein